MTTLPILSDSVDKDDVVGLADGDFGGIRRERHVVDSVALFPILGDGHSHDKTAQPVCSVKNLRNITAAQWMTGVISGGNDALTISISLY